MNATSITFINELRHNPSVVVKLADKSLGMTLVPSTWYEAVAAKHLNDERTYKRIRFHNEVIARYRLFFKTVDNILDQLKEIMQFDLSYKQFFNFLKQSTVTQRSTLLTTEQADAQTHWSSTISPIYFLPKIHKLSTAQYEQITSTAAPYTARILLMCQLLKARPIVACTNAITTPLSKIGADLLKKHVTKHDTILRDSLSLVRTLEQLHIPHSTSTVTLLTFDVESLYTNLNTTNSLERVKNYLNDNNEEYTALTMQILHTVLNNSFLTFNNEVYEQKTGTAMGTNLAPPYANLVVHTIERDAIAELKSVIVLYRRFLDDGFIITTKPETVQQALNTAFSNQGLTLTWNSSTQSVDYLDLVIFKGERYTANHYLDLRCHQKAFNRYLYIPYNSFHLPSSKISTLRTELIRYVRNCSNELDYLQLRRALYDRLRARKYHHAFLAPLFAETDSLYLQRSQLLQPRATNAHKDAIAKRNFIALPFDPTTQLMGANHIVRDCHSILTSDTLTTKYFARPPVTTYRKGTNLASHLIRARYTASTPTTSTIRQPQPPLMYSDVLVETSAVANPNNSVLSAD